MLKCLLGNCKIKRGLGQLPAVTEMSPMLLARALGSSGREPRFPLARAALPAALLLLERWLCVGEGPQTLGDCTPGQAGSLCFHPATHFQTHHSLAKALGFSLNASCLGDLPQPLLRGILHTQVLLVVVPRGTSVPLCCGWGGNGAPYRQGCPINSWDSTRGTVWGSCLSWAGEKGRRCYL